ncbi:unnamed protein product [Peronospora farinosa]|uniref:Reverse transcriptase Ty1/copia-type domain-containing protein n=1 Tax=Peronospora farinosa TaxID=134698 RepID=A0AAV0T0E4_9STRA|nr:unnamed protein product [Peronospora farinosa]
MIITAKISKKIQEVKTSLKHSFKMENLGEVKFIIGMEFEHDRNGITLMIRQTRSTMTCQQHWKAAIRVLRYLKTTRDYGIIYDGSAKEVQATAYTVEDWGSNIDDRRSVSGIMVMIGGAPVVFKSKYQLTVALSSAEVEHRALCFVPRKYYGSARCSRISVMSKYERLWSMKIIKMRLDLQST